MRGLTVRGAIAVGVLGTVLGGAPAWASVPPSTPSDASAQDGGGPVGEASAIEVSVELQAVNAESAPLAAQAAVSVGDVVRTDATGYAEIAYTEGSFTRLDVNTEFTVVALVDDAGNAGVRAEMGLGQTWNRVESAGGEFSVETSAASATVTGTAFAIRCVAVGSCVFLVVEGSVQLGLPDGSTVDVEAPAWVDVTNGVVTGPTPLSWDGVFGDPWLVDNTDRDATAGFPDRATIYQAYGPAYASLVGTFAGTTTVTNVTCVSYCLSDSGPENIGVESPSDNTYSVLCGGQVCSVVGPSGVPYTFDGTVHRVQIPSEPSPCTLREFDTVTSEVLETVEPGTLLSSATTTLTPIDAAVVDGTYVVTALSFRQERIDSVEGFCAEEVPGGPDADTIEELLALPPYLGMTIVFEGAVSLVDGV